MSFTSQSLNRGDLVTIKSISYIDGPRTALPANCNKVIGAVGVIQDIYYETAVQTEVYVVGFNQTVLVLDGDRYPCWIFFKDQIELAFYGC